MTALAERIVGRNKAVSAAVAPDERTKALQELRAAVLQETTRGAADTLRSANGDPTEYLKALLIGSRPSLVPGESIQDASKCAALRMAGYKHSLALLAAQESCMTEGQATSVVCALGSELGSDTAAADLHRITEAAVEAFEGDGPLACAPLGLLPRAITMLRALGAGGEDGGGAAGVSDSCTGFVLRVTNHAWPAGNIAKVLAALRDVPMSAESLAQVVRRAAQRARSADLQDLPTIVHQLLVLSGRGCREVVLAEVVRLFDRLEAAAPADSGAQRRRLLLEVEGSVLLHLDMAVKHDAELGQAWVRRLRTAGPAWRPSPFALAVCFVLAGVQRFELPVTELLRTLVTATHKDEASRRSAAWLPPPSEDEGGSGVGAALVACVRNSGQGQGTIVQPAVALALALMEGSGAGAKPAAANRAAGWYLPERSLDGAAAPPAVRSADLGTRLLVEVFVGHKESRRDILSLCNARLVGAKEDAALPFVRLIALLVRRHPALVSSHVADLRSALEHLPALPPSAALALLLAVWPLCRARRDVRDFVVMLLRKAMFSREVGARVVAARGFLFLITEELRRGEDEAGAVAAAGPSCSQAMLSQRDALAGGGATLLHELMSFLRRCLAQQAEVRRAVYAGLPAMLEADPAAREAVAEHLLPHLLAYYERDEALPAPIKLEACVAQQGDGRARVVEPLHHLLACVRRVLCVPDPAAQHSGLSSAPSQLTADRQGDGDEGGAAAPVLRRLFASLRTRLGSCPLEDFAFDNSTPFAASEANGEVNQAQADVLLGCYEVLAEDLVAEIQGVGATDAGRSEELAVELLALFKQHRRLSELAGEAMKGKKGARGEGATQAAAPGFSKKAAAGPAAALDKRSPVLSVGCLVSLLTAIVEDGLLPGGSSAAPTQSAHLKLARDVDFQTFVLTACRRVLQRGGGDDVAAAVAAGTAGGEAGSSLLFALPDLGRLAPPLFAAVQTTLLARCRERSAPVPGAKRERDDGEALTQAAAAALEQLLAAAGGGIQALASLLRGVPPASRQLRADAELPEAGCEADGALAVVAARLPLFKQLLDVLVEHGCSKELEAVCAALQALAPALPPPFAAAVATWAETASASAPTRLSHHPPAARALVELALRCRGAAGGLGDVDALCTLSQEIVTCVNADGAAADTGTLAFTPSESLPLLGPKSLNAVVGAAIAHLEACMASLDWALARLRTAAGAAAGDDALAAALGRQRAVWEDLAFRRLRRLADAAALLAEARLSGPPCKALAKALTKLYRLLGAAAKCQGAAKGFKQAPPCAAFQELADAINAALTPKVYHFITGLQDDSMADPQQENDNGGGGEGGKAAKAAARRHAAQLSRARRGSRAIPNLVYQVEAFEKQLIALSKSGRLNLMQHARRATARDFKFDVTEAKKRRRGGGGGDAAGEESEGEGEGEEEEEGSGNEEECMEV